MLQMHGTMKSINQVTISTIQAIILIQELDISLRSFGKPLKELVVVLLDQLWSADTSLPATSWDNTRKMFVRSQLKMKPQRK